MDVPLIDTPGTDWTDSVAVRATLDAVPRGLLIFDSERRLLFANAAAKSALRSVPGPCAFEELLTLIDPRTERPVAPDRGPLARALRGESIDSEEYIVRRPREAGTHWFECGARPTLAADGAITGAVFAFSNITERKRKELAREAADQLRDFIYHENLAGIIRSTVDGRILDCNDAILRMFRYGSKQELFAVRAPSFTTIRASATAF